MPPAPHIAVIDDEDAVRKALRRLLRSAGMTVETYSGGAEFLSSLAKYQPDCAVLDLHMPDVAGFDVLSWLTERHLKVPVVAITGNDSAEAEISALGGGASAYLRKPVSAALLIDSISSAVKQAALGPPHRKSRPD